MSDWTPTTQQVREQFTREEPPPIDTVAEKSQAFDRWLEQVKAEAREEGKRAARPLPTREEIADVILAESLFGSRTPTAAADAVLALLKEQEK